MRKFGKKFELFKQLMENNVPLEVVRLPSGVGAIAKKNNGEIVAQFRASKAVVEDYFLPHIGHELSYEQYGGGCISALIAIYCKTCGNHEILADADESE